MVEKQRVLIIGVDAATFDLIEPWISEGRLPNLAKLVEAGSSGRLASTLQPATAPAWVTMMTGVNQGRHGLYDFVRRRPGTYAIEVTNGSHVGSPTILELLSQAGMRVISINVPYTSPPRPINGVVVGGPFAPVLTPDTVYPPDFYTALRDVVPDYFVFPEYRPQASDPLGDLASVLLREIEQRETLSRHLLRTAAWDLFMVVFMATDEAHHTYWAAMEAAETDPLARYRHVIRDVYVRVDQAIGTLIEAANAGGSLAPNVFVLSDHGAGRFRAMINLNHWLAGAGLFAFRTHTDNPMLRHSSHWLRQLAHSYRRHVPTPVRKAIRTRLGARRFDQAKGEFETALVTSTVDWGRTRAYALGVGGNIFVNLRGREPQGQVEPGAEYEQVRQTIIQQLGELTDPETGQRVVRRIHRREDLYHGDCLAEAPDLIVEWMDYAYWGKASFEHPATPVFQPQHFFDFSTQPLSGSHRPEGILIGQGPRVKRGGRHTGARLLDVAPTILHLLGVAPAAALDGRLLDEWLTQPNGGDTVLTVEPALTSHGLTKAYTAEEAQLVTERLRALGYL